MKNKHYLSKSLLLTALMGILAFGLFQAKLTAGDNQYISAKTDGSSLQISPDGSKFFKDSDGSSVQMMPDGSKMIKKPDGTSIHVMPDGSKMIRKPDGTSVEIKPGA